jgi:hypothetical protein
MIEKHESVEGRVAFHGIWRMEFHGIYGMEWNGTIM